MREALGALKEKLGPNAIWLIAGALVLFLALRSRSSAADPGSAAPSEAPLPAVGGYSGGGSGSSDSGADSYDSILASNLSNARAMQELQLEGARSQMGLDLEQAQAEERLRQQAETFNFGQEKEAGLFALDLAGKQSDLDSQKLVRDFDLYKSKANFDFALGQEDADAQLNRSLFKSAYDLSLDVKRLDNQRYGEAQTAATAIDAQIAALGARPEVRGRNFLTGKRKGAKEAAEYDKQKAALEAKAAALRQSRPVAIDTAALFNQNLPTFSYKGRGA